MDNKTIFTKTAKGVGEAVGKTRALSRDLRIVLKEVDGKASLEELLDKITGLSQAKLQAALSKLSGDDYIREFVAPTVEDDSLDFITILPLPEETERAPGQRTRINEALRMQLEARARTEAEAHERIEKAQEQRERRGGEEHARREQEKETARAAQQQAMKEAQETARLEADERAAQKLAEQAQQEAEQQARRAADAARWDAAAQAKKDTEERMRQEAEAQAAEQKLQLEIAAKAKQDAEEKSRYEAEQQALRQAEERARDDALQQARREAEEQARKNAEIEAHRLADEQACLEKEAARQKEEADAEALKEAQQAAQQAAQEAAQRETEEQARRDAAQAELKKEAEEQRRKLATEHRARRDAEVRAKKESEEQARREAEERARQDVEEKSRREADLRIRQELEQQALDEAEDRARQAAEEKSRHEADERIRQQLEQQARIELEARVRNEAEEKSRSEAEALANKEAEEEIRRAFEELTRQQAEAESRRKAEQARRQIEAVAQRKAEAKAKKAEEGRARRQLEEVEALREAEVRAKQEVEQWMHEAAKEKAGLNSAEETMPAQVGYSASHTEDPAAPNVAGPVAQNDRYYEEQYEQGEPEPIQPEVEKKSFFKTNRGSRGTPIKWIKPVALGLSLSILAGFSLLHVMAFDSKAALFEKAATAQLQQPVKIGKVYLSLFPQPQWRLKDVSIGANGQIAISKINASTEWSGLFSGDTAFKSIELQSPVFSEQALEWLLFGPSRQSHIKVGAVTASNATIASKNISLPSFNAAADIGADGAWRKITLDSLDRKTRLHLRPGGATVQVELNAESFVMPFGSTLKLEEFSARGTANRNELVITDFSGRAYGGILTGTANLQWGAAWSMKGNVQVKLIEAAQLAPTLLQNGKLAGTATYSVQAENADQLFALPRVQGSFIVQNGTLLGIDFAKILRGATSTGTSSFAELAGTFIHEGGKTQLQKMYLNAGLLSVTGYAEMDKSENLNGRLAVELKSPTQQARSSLTVAGTLKGPQFNR